MEQNNNQPATEEQMLAVEALTAQLIAQKLQEVRTLSQQIMAEGEGGGEDPLIALKQKELDLRGQKTQADIGIDQGKLNLEEQKVIQRGEQFDERLDSQEKQTTERIRASDRRENMRLREKAGETP